MFRHFGVVVSYRLYRFLWMWFVTWFFVVWRFSSTFIFLLPLLHPCLLLCALWHYELNENRVWNFFFSLLAQFLLNFSARCFVRCLIYFLSFFVLCNNGTVLCDEFCRLSARWIWRRHTNTRMRKLDENWKQVNTLVLHVAPNSAPFSPHLSLPRFSVPRMKVRRREKLTILNYIAWDFELVRIMKWHQSFLVSAFIVSTFSCFLFPTSWITRCHGVHTESFHSRRRTHESKKREKVSTEHWIWCNCSPKHISSANKKNCISIFRKYFLAKLKFGQWSNTSRCDSHANVEWNFMAIYFPSLSVVKKDDIPCLVQFHSIHFCVSAIAERKRKTRSVVFVSESNDFGLRFMMSFETNDSKKKRQRFRWFFLASSFWCHENRNWNARFEHFVLSSAQWKIRRKTNSKLQRNTKLFKMKFHQDDTKRKAPIEWNRIQSQSNESLNKMNSAEFVQLVAHNHSQPGFVFLIWENCWLRRQKANRTKN